MSRLKRQILLLTVLCIVSYSESELGKTCRNQGSCARSLTFVEKELCMDGICRCNPDYEVRYSSSLHPRCGDIILSLNMFDKSCELKTCGEGEYCKERPAPYPSFDRRDKQIACICKTGFLRINSDCREATLQKVLGSCYVPKNGTVKSCDVNENSFCKNGKCVCFETYFANVTSGKCEPQANYLKAYNLTEYRVKPYEYCYSNSDCILGLECSNYQCECPGPCKYNETAEICDCGIIEKPPPPEVKAPTIVGVLLGLGIVAFWYHTIKKMIKRYAEKKNASPNEVTATGETHPTYALQPVPPRNESMGTSTPREVAAPSNIPEKQSLLPAETNSDRNAYIPPPQPSQYGFSTPHVSSALPPFSPGAPPPYSLLPSAADSPPPYSLNPQEGSFNDSIPDSSTSSYLPYPYNATTPNPATVGPANPTGSDGLTAPVLNPSSALPYPVSPAISGPMSTSTTLPSAPSYALGSNSASAPKQE